MFQANLVPGQGFILLTILEKEGGKAKSNRPQSKYAETRQSFYGMICSAPQKEIEEWKQRGHPISHEITTFYPTTKAKATDYLQTEDGRKFYVEGLKTPGGLNTAYVYYVEERRDLK